MGKNKEKRFSLVVIGAGASGMTAALTAARSGKSVLIIEKLDKVGKKLLATGNGKCNFTNANMGSDCYGGDKAFIESILSRFSVEDCLSFFHQIGIYPKNKNGYYYPNSEQASSVVQALLNALNQAGVKISYETQVLALSSSESGVSISTNHGDIFAEKLIIATGLLAAPKLGSDGSMFTIIKKLGHSLNPVLPALCGYYCKGINFKKISGVRSTGKVTAFINGEKQAEDTGEIQFTDYGLSGIPVFQISRFLSKGLHNKAKVEIGVNLLPDFTDENLRKELNFRKENFKEEPLENFFNGLLNQKLGLMVLEKCNLDRNQFILNLQNRDFDKIINTLQNLMVTVTNYRDYEFAQVCTGGIPVTEIDSLTLQSNFANHVHFTGELLDVDGICGGYNLHFAWATGFIAGSDLF